MKYSGSTGVNFNNLARVLLSRAMKFHLPPTSIPKFKFGSPKLGTKAWGPGVSLKNMVNKPADLPKGDTNEPFEGGL